MGTEIKLVAQTLSRIVVGQVHELYEVVAGITNDICSKRVAPRSFRC